MANEEIGKQFVEIPKGKLPPIETDKTWGIPELRENSEKYGISGNEAERMSIFKEIQEALKQEQFENLVKDCIPRNGGEWSGKEGDSTWKPTSDEIPKKQNEEGQTWEEILEKYKIEGIEFKDGEPDFSSVSEASVEIEDFSESRNENFTQADEKLAEQWTAEGKDGKEWSAQDVKAYRQENNLTWHERSDMKTLDLVPQKIHNNIPHSGGISAKKQEQGAA